VGPTPSLLHSRPVRAARRDSTAHLQTIQDCSVRGAREFLTAAGFVEVRILRSASTTAM
jgi:hypothetical protein